MFVFFALGMFFYGYGILETKNQALSIAAMERESEFQLLEVEQKSFEQGQKDLQNLSKKNVPPNELFSKDTKVVKEIKVLEEIAAQNGLLFSLTISGTTKSAVKAPGTTSEVFVIPYSANLEGNYESIMKYLQQSEHLSFVTHTKQMTMSVTEKGTLKAALNSEFYIKK